MDHDVIIAGAGLTGRLLALSLAHRGLASVVIDPAPEAASPTDPRTTALAFASVRLLIRLGLWDDLEGDAGAINDILVTNGVPRDRYRPGGVTGGALHFPASLLPEERRSPGELPLGFIVRNSAMLDRFEQAVTDSPLITRRYGAAVTGISPRTGNVMVRTSDGDDIVGGAVAACDGKGSPIRKTHGFRQVSWGYSQKAIAFNIDHELPHGGVAQEVFYPGGPFAILPLANNSCSIVWTERGRQADSIMDLPAEAFLAEAKARIGDYLGNITLASQPVTFPLSFGYVLTPAKDRIVLLGDAAHTIHPIAGQGFNLGIKDIAAFTDTLAEARQTGLDIGHGSVLESYVQWRRFDTASMSFGTDVLNRLFSNSIAPIRWARSVGLGLVQKIDPMRIALMRQSGADTGTLPSLMQPL